MTTRTWTQYLAGQSLEGYLNYLAFHAPLVRAVVENAPGRVLETGCGGANLSIFSAHLGASVTAVDLERGVIFEARQHAGALRANVRFVSADALRLPFADDSFDIAFSQGVLEHFDDKLIEAFLAESLRAARRVVASVPNCNYPTRDFGNERLMPADFWRDRATAAVRAAGMDARVDVSDYRRRLFKKHPLRTAMNWLMRRGIMTLIVIERQ